jgi:hypothetical protein
MIKVDPAVAATCSISGEEQHTPRSGVSTLMYAALRNQLAVAVNSPF